jgi:TRAP-type mannitol/chloroaromatic compound transport system permease small subunit
MNEFIGKWIGWLILLSILISAGNAIIRKVLNTSSNAWLEAQWYLFGAAFLLAAAYTLKQNEHIRIDMSTACSRVERSTGSTCWARLLPDALRHPDDLYFMPYFLLSYRTGEVSTNAGGLTIWPAKLMLLVGFVLLGIQGVSEIIKKIAVMRGDMEDPNPFVSAHEAAELEGKALVEELKQ